MEEEEAGFFKTNFVKEIPTTHEEELVLPIKENCLYCNSLPLEKEIKEKFKLNVCKECRFKKLRFVTKTTAVKEFLLSNYDIKHLNYISRPNPHKGGWYDMQLFLYDEILEICLKKYKSLEDVEQIKKDREDKLENRKIKKLKIKIRDLKRRTIYKGNDRIKGHEHEFVEQGRLKRCLHCDMKIEQEEI